MKVCFLKLVLIIFTIVISLLIIGCESIIEPPGEGSEPSLVTSLPIISNITLTHGSSITKTDVQTYNIGYCRVSDPKEVSFTISNTGEDVLSLLGDPVVSVIGNGFHLSKDMARVIEPGLSESFSVTFLPGGTGAYSATVLFKENKVNGGEYRFRVTGTATDDSYPQIQVKNGTQLITHDSTIIFDDKRIAQTEHLNLVVRNTGSVDLILDEPQITNTNGLTIHCDYTTVRIAPGDYTVISVALGFNAIGNGSGIISIPTNDPFNNPFSINFNTQTAGPVIELSKGVMDTPVNGELYDIGDCTVSHSVDITFMVTNTGNMDMGSATKPLTIQTAGSVFSVKEPIAPVIEAGESSSFVVTFKPNGIKVFEGHIHIRNTMAWDSGIYSLRITGRGVSLPSAAIAVGHESVEIVNGTKKYDIGVYSIDTTHDILFTIENTGEGQLELTGTPAVSVTGSYAYHLQKDADPIVGVGPGDSTTFILRYHPHDAAVHNATITLVTNDPDNPFFQFTLCGAGIAPDIRIDMDNRLIPNGGNFITDPCPVDVSTDFVFTITNTGGDRLVLAGMPRLAVSGPGFYVKKDAPVYIEPDGTADIVVTFIPGSVGAFVGLLSIATNDPDENPYTFTISGTGAGSDIRIKTGPDEILNSDFYKGTPTTSLGSYLDIPFTITNSGSVPLVLTGDPYVQLSGKDSEHFTLIQPEDTMLGTYESAEFILRFEPGTVGTKQIDIIIPNNSETIDPFTFKVMAKVSK